MSAPKRRIWYRIAGSWPEAAAEKGFNVPPVREDGITAALIDHCINELRRHTLSTGSMPVTSAVPLTDLPEPVTGDWKAASYLDAHPE